METYLFKFSACLVVFWLVYVLFLERQTMHRLKRFYLLGAVVLALTIPLLTLTQYVEPIATDFEVSQFNVPMETTFVELPQEQQPFLDLETALWLLYGLGALVFGIRFIINLFNMYRRIANHETIKKYPFVYVLLDNCPIPHSFFKYLFFECLKYKTDAIPEEVKLHEETHAKQWHSLDIIIIELLQIIFWFHPLIYMLKHHIKLNHEFLADQAVLAEGIDTTTYQNTLLQFSSHAQEHQLASTINYASIKKRFTVMKTQTSETRIWLSSLLLLPIIAVLFYSFAEKKYVEKETTDVVNLIKEGLDNPNNDYDSTIEEQKIPKTILTVLINKKEELFINGELGNLKSLEKVLQNLRIPQNYTINVEGEKQSSPEMIKGVLTLIKKYNLLLNPSKIQLPKTEQKASYNPTFLEYIIEMEEKGASFYLDGNKISAKQAKSIAKTNIGKRTEMLTQKDANGHFVVKLSSQQNPPTAKEVAEYNTWAKKLKKETLAAQDNERNGRKANYPIVKQKDLVRYVGIYKRMTPTQKQNSAELPLADDELKTTGLKFPPPPPPQQNPPAAKEIAEYNTWAKTLNDQMAKAEKKEGNNKWNAYPIIKQKDVDKYKAIYNSMTELQRKSAVPFPKGPPPPPPPPPPPAPKSKDKSGKSQNQNTIQPVEITIKKDRSLALNGKSVSLENLIPEAKKLNQHLTTEQQREYVMASMIVEQNKDADFAKELQQRLREADIYNMSVGYNEARLKSGLSTKHFNLNAGLTVEEARKAREELLKDDNNGEKLDKLIDSLNQKDGNKWSYKIESFYVESSDASESGMKELKYNGNTYSYYKSKDKNNYVFYDKYGLIVDKEKIKTLMAHVTPTKKPLTYTLDDGEVIEVEEVPETENPQEVITVIINGQALKNNTIQLTVDAIKTLELTLSKGKVSSFKLKIPGVKTDFINGSTISKISIGNLNKVYDGDVITLFDIKDDKNTQLPPVIIEIVE